MEILIWILSVLVWIAFLVYYIQVLMKIFQSGDTTMGIICLVTVVCCGLGGLITFIVGWVRQEQYGTQKLMPTWTIIVILHLIINGTAFAILR